MLTTAHPKRFKDFLILHCLEAKNQVMETTNNAGQKYPEDIFKLIMSFI